MTGWADDEQARRLIARDAHQQTDLEGRLLKVAQDVFPRIRRLRVVAGNHPQHGAGWGIVMVDTEDRRGHAVGGQAGFGIEAAGVVEANLREMTREAAIYLGALCHAPRVMEVGKAH